MFFCLVAHSGECRSWAWLYEERIYNFIQKINPYPEDKICTFLIKFWLNEYLNFTNWIRDLFAG